MAATPAWMLKMDAATRMIIPFNDGPDKQKGLAWASDQHPFRVSPQEGAVVDLLVKLDDPASVSRLEALGARPHVRVGDIVGIRIPPDGLQRLAEAPFVRFIEISKPGYPTTDASRASIRADLVHEGFGLPQSYQGEGTVVGIIDTGIDFTHPDFSDDNGSRIQYVWDMSGTSATDRPTDIDPSFTWGREYTKAQIDDDPGQVQLRDPDGAIGHGTHVAGIAAGGGRANPIYQGMAPKADLVFVKGTRDPTSAQGPRESDLLAAFVYVFERAAQLGKPAVANLSLSIRTGPRDGTSLLEQAFSDLTGPGRLIVTSVGNNGFDPVHAGGLVLPDTINATLLQTNNPDNALVDLWYKPGAVTAVQLVAYALNSPDVLAASEWVAVGSQQGVDVPIVFRGASGQPLGLALIDARTTQDARNGDGNVFIFISSNNSPLIDISQVRWGILVSGGATEERVDLWTFGGVFEDEVVGLSEMHEIPGDTDYTITSPATATKTIAVGSFVSKTVWTDIDGTTHQWQDPIPGNPIPPLGQRSAFSGNGPTRDGRNAPDVLAPGQLIVSALSSHVTEGVGVDRDRIVEGGMYRFIIGTSQSAPHVTGVLALMLQADPTLDYDQAVQILRETARLEADDDDVPNTELGWGRLDALAAVQRTLQRAGPVAIDDEGELPDAVVLHPNYPNPFHPFTSIAFTLPANARVTLTIYDVLGREVAQLADAWFSAGTYTVPFDGNGLSNGLYVYQLRVAGQTHTRKMLLLK